MKRFTFCVNLLLNTGKFLTYKFAINIARPGTFIILFSALMHMLKVKRKSLDFQKC